MAPDERSVDLFLWGSHVYIHPVATQIFALTYMDDSLQIGQQTNSAICMPKRSRASFRVVRFIAVKTQSSMFVSRRSSVHQGRRSLIDLAADQYAPCDLQHILTASESTVGNPVGLTRTDVGEVKSSV